MTGVAAAAIGRLAARLAEPAPRRLMTVPGCWDALTAVLIEQAGFEAAFLTGGGFSMARLGQPDMGLVTASEVIETVALIRDRITLPLIVDGDTGYGNALNMQRTVRAYERAGASAIQIEDQGFPKRCGHMAGKTVVPLPEALGRVKAALDARERMLVIARTDAASVEGIDAAIERSEAYLEAGADLIFVEGPKTMADTEAVAARFAARVPIVHNLVEGGTTATEEGAELERMGFAVALHPLILMHGFVAAAPGWLARLKAARSTTAMRDELLDLKRMNALLDVDALVAAGNRYG